jgi:nicotinamidase-related amidase
VFAVVFDARGISQKICFGHGRDPLKFFQLLGIQMFNFIGALIHSTLTFVDVLLALFHPFNACIQVFATPLKERLQARGITRLIFGGVTTEVCVQTTMREANDRGFECLLAEDATESYFPHFKAATLEMIRAQGAIVGWTATVDQIVAALHV